MKITKTALDKLSTPTSGQAFYRDDQLKGFAVRITQQGVRSFILEKRINGKVKRYTLGRYPEVTVEAARKMAQVELGKIAQGINPISEKKANECKQKTLQEIYNDYLTSRKSMKPKTKHDYDYALQHHLQDWCKKPILTITKNMVTSRHIKIGKSSPATANLTMRLLRAVFNFAKASYEDEYGKPIITENPVGILSQTRAWYRIERRDSVIKAHELPLWYKTLNELTQHRKDPETTALIQDYLLLVLFTGLRKQEAAGLRWEWIDFKDRTFMIPDTKNGTKHVLPMSDYIEKLLQRRRQASTHHLFVFPANSTSGHLEEPKKAMIKITELSGINFTLHDLRRTFITIADSLDIALYALKRLLNHKMSTDVTAGYIVMDVERLRSPMQKITDYILSLVGEKQSATVIPIKSMS
ncbi:MAG: integrase [Coxiella sp. RIFCSPHIGHO2_12_FULL_42_15]|nr:MAG: integrase [Coxiella sp. RIFCSPHIGHO2_12_FULL_42_15]